MLTVVFALIGSAFIVIGGALVHVENIRRWPGVCAGTIGGFLVAIATVMIFSGGYL